MKIYGYPAALNMRDDFDTIANCINARQSSAHRPDGKQALRSAEQKRRLRRIIKRRARAQGKKDIISQLIETE